MGDFFYAKEVQKVILSDRSKISFCYVQNLTGISSQSCPLCDCRIPPHSLDQEDTN